MIANYHTHTPRCHHAVGTEEEYVLNAIDGGLQILGFADHTPYPFPAGFVSSFRMGVHELEDYACAVRSMRAKYGQQIQIHLGVEAEYYPKYFPELMDLLRDHGVEYMILGQHMIGNEIDEPYCGIPSGDFWKLERYCNQSIDALHTGLFTYFAHPDLFHYVGDRELYQQQVRRICRAANECHVPLELNLLGLQGNRHYPNPLFWEVAAEENCRVILGMDAHRPEALQDRALAQQGLDFLAQYGLTPMDTVPLRSIR